ncbi:MAG: NUDIX domain-containing protein [Thermoplasmata archaeon]
MSRTTEPYRADLAIVPELAAGVVIVLDPEGTVFLLHQADEDRWCLPKGHVDPGESLATAALREVREEAGFERVELEGEVQEVSYRFYHPRRNVNIHKSVVYFLGRTRERAARLEPIFDRSEWVSPEGAVRRVRYATDRTVLDTVRDHLAGGSSTLPNRSTGK